MPGMTGARLLVEALRAAGAEVVFTLSGNQILAIYDACLDTGLRVVDTRHESAAVHMADAYARLTGRPAVCLVTAGPGHTNALTGLGTAWFAESPVLLLSGGSERARDGKGAFQEIDQVALAAPLCKLARRAERAAELPALVAEARAMQSGRPGPAHLTLPVDVLQAEATAALPPPEAYTPSAQPADEAAVREAAAWLANAERPLVLGSPGLAWGRAGQAFRALLGAGELPGFIIESPRGLTDPALHGAGALFREADVVLLLAPQDYALGFATPAALAEHGRLIESAPVPAALGRNRPADLALVGDPVLVLEQLRRELAARPAPPAARAAWRRHLAERQAAERARLAAAERASEQPLHPLRVCAEVRARLGVGDVVAIDGGEFGQWARWAFGGAEPRVLLNGKFGMIGCGIPFALGARLAAPSARVVAFVGDGTFGFHGFELDTAVRHGLPCVVIVGNDAGWAAERHRQVALYGPQRLVASDLLPTRYDEVARGLGADGVLVERAEELGPALDQALASGRPTVINVRIASIPSPAAAAG